MNCMQPIRRERLKAFVPIALALCSVIALALMLPTTSPLHERTNSAVWILCMPGLYFIIRHACEGFPLWRDRLYFCGFGLLFSLVYVLGRYIYLYHAVKSPVTVLLTAVMLTPALAAVLATVALRFLRRAALPACDLAPGQRAFFERRHLFFLVFVILLVCYLPCYLAFYPANIQYDIGNQTLQAVTGVFSTNHPLLHTLLIKACLDAGAAFLGGYSGGFALYAAVQAVLLIGCFSYAFCCIVHLTPRRTAFHWIVLAFFALYPTNHLFAVTTTKDVLASGAMLVSLSALSLLLFDPLAAKAERGRVTVFVISTMLAMLLRNSVVYAYLALALILLVCIKRFGFRLLLATLLSAGLFFGVSTCLKSALHASDSSPVELLSVPIQQIVYASIESPECFTPEEKAQFDALIETNARFQPQIVDPIKEFIDKDFLIENQAAYWALYRSIGKKAPADYVNAFLTLNLAIWYPDEITHANVHSNNQGYLHASGWYYRWDKAPAHGEKHSLLPRLETLYEKFAMDNLHQKIPVVSMLFSPGFLCQVLFVLAVFVLYRRRLTPLLVFVPLIAYWIGLLFAPCIYIRYVYPIILCLPLLTALTQNAFTDNQTPRN